MLTLVPSGEVPVTLGVVSTTKITPWRVRIPAVAVWMWKVIVRSPSCPPWVSIQVRVGRVRLSSWKPSNSGTCMVWSVVPSPPTSTVTSVGSEM